MLFFLVSCLSFLLLSQSFFRPHPPYSKMKPFPSFFKDFLIFLIQKRKILFTIFQVPKSAPPPDRIPTPRNDATEDKTEISLLDLPDLALDSILEKLSPVEVCSLAGCCRSMREKCTSDHVWEKRMREKWGSVLGDAAYREWQAQIASRRAPRFLHSASKGRGFGLLSGLVDFLGLKSGMMDKNEMSFSSVMYCYLALENGKFWFPAQVFNRENGHAGFMLSCYDAHLSYGSTTDNFIARYKANGRCMIEEGIEWKRIRAPIVNTPSNVLHISDCLDELKPNDHIEIQWRKNKDFPYGWWYGVVGHLDSCNGNEFTCRCHIYDTVVLEFKQYAPGSRWRKAAIDRRDHREVGDAAEGFYGGVRKLWRKEEIEKWKQLWPNCTLR